MHPSVSVVIPAYRVTEYIAEAIDSVLAQTFRQFEIIVVNDGCPDSVNLESVLAPYLAAGKIACIRQENRGLSGARNSGIRAAQGEFVAVLDGDDRLHPGALEVWTEMMRHNAGAGMVYGNGMFFGGTEFDGQDLMTTHPSPSGSVTFDELVTRKAHPFACAMFRRDRLLGLGLYDESLRKAEDFDIALRTAASGASIENTKTIVYDYRVRPDGLSQSGADIRAWRIRVLEKHRDLATLSSAEKELIAGELRYQYAELALDESRTALRNGDYVRARSRLRAAQQELKSMRLKLISLGLHVAPQVIRQYAAFRDSR